MYPLPTPLRLLLQAPVLPLLRGPTRRHHMPWLPRHRSYGSSPLQLPHTYNGSGLWEYVDGPVPGTLIPGGPLADRRSSSTADRFWFLSFITFIPVVGLYPGGSPKGPLHLHLLLHPPLFSHHLTSSRGQEVDPPPSFPLTINNNQCITGRQSVSVDWQANAQNGRFTCAWIWLLSYFYNNFHIFITTELWASKAARHVTTT